MIVDQVHPPRRTRTTNHVPPHTHTCSFIFIFIGVFTSIPTSIDVFLLILVVMYLHYYYCNILVPNAFIYVQTRLVTLLWYEQGIFSLGTALTGHFLFLLILSLDP